jgi:hypothetical protein
VVADATNVLALKIASEFKYRVPPFSPVRLACVHRHLRCQFFENHNYTSHFSVLALVSGGRDQGNYLFEVEEILTHIKIVLSIITQNAIDSTLILRFFIKKGSQSFGQKLVESMRHSGPQINFEFVDDLENNYYHLIQYKIYSKVNEIELNLADGGFVDWTQKILSDRKQRMCISGIGLELLIKLIKGDLKQE